MHHKLQEPVSVGVLVSKWLDVQGSHGPAAPQHRHKHVGCGRSAAVRSHLYPLHLHLLVALRVHLVCEHKSPALCVPGWHRKAAGLELQVKQQ